MIWRVWADGQLEVSDALMPCSLGRTGVAEVASKREGDGSTPAGLWPLRWLYYRGDRVSRPQTRLPTRALEPTDGWCDEPADPNYNRLVGWPYPASAEHLWREDNVYDLIVVLGFNDDPVVAGAGSAIFLHLWRTESSSTEGCVAISKANMTSFLRHVGPGDALLVTPAVRRGPQIG